MIGTDGASAPGRGGTAPRLLDLVLHEIEAVAARLADPPLRLLADSVISASRVFVTGEGRSGFMARAFAMRLMHIGSTVHVVGETTTPAIGAGDLLVAVSGSGTTAGTLHAARQAIAAGAVVHGVTADPESPLALVAHEALVLPAATKHRRPGEPPTVQPLSSLFDQVAHVALDVVCLTVARMRSVDNGQASSAHANL